MTFKKWYKSEYKLHKVSEYPPAYLLMEKSWNAAIEESAKIADKYFRHMVSRVIAEEIRNREA